MRTQDQIWPDSCAEPTDSRISHLAMSWPTLLCTLRGLGRTGQGRAGQGRAGQGRAGQGRAGQGRAGQGRAGQQGSLYCNHCKPSWPCIAEPCPNTHTHIPAMLSRPTTKVGSSIIVASPEALSLPGSVAPSSLSSRLSLRESRALWPSDFKARLLSEVTTPYAE